MLAFRLAHPIYVFRSHTNPVALCGGKIRRNVKDLVSLCAQLHEEVRKLQKLSVQTRAAVDKHIDHQLKQAAKAAEEKKLSKLCTATSTSFWTISEGCLGSSSPHTRRVLCSTWLPCLLDADWYLRSDVMTDSCLQALS